MGIPKRTLLAVAAVMALAVATLTSGAVLDGGAIAPASVRVVGRSAVAAAPGLAALATVGRQQCSSYFECGTETAKVDAKFTSSCYFKVAPRAAARGAGAFVAEQLCRDTPYDCEQSSCSADWRRCKCDTCKKVKIEYKIWCEI